MLGKSTRNFAAALCASLLTSAAVQAAPMTFVGDDISISPISGEPEDAETNFLSGLSGVDTEDFESFSDGKQNPELQFSGSSNNTITAKLTNGTVQEGVSSEAGRFATSGSKWLEDEGKANLKISFSDPISAFGFFGTDVGDLGAELTLTLTDSNNDEETLDVGNSTKAFNGSTLFFGFIDSDKQYTDIVFEDPNSKNDFFGFDEITVGDSGQVGQQSGAAAVPVPATVGLLSIGLFGLSLVARRRREA